MPRERKLRVCIIVAKFNTHLNMQDGTSVQENSVRNGSSAVCLAPPAQESCALFWVIVKNVYQAEVMVLIFHVFLYHSSLKIILLT